MVQLSPPFVIPPVFPLLLLPPLTPQLYLLTRTENWALNHQHQRGDVNPTHLSAFDGVMDGIKRDWWTDKYPENIHLNLLCTLPSYHQCGTGTKLTCWGVDTVIGKGAVVAVESSPMGLSPYRRLRFNLIDTRVVQVDGEEEELLVRIMVFVPEQKGAAAAVPREIEGGGGGRLSPCID